MRHLAEWLESFWLLWPPLRNWNNPRGSIPTSFENNGICTDKKENQIFLIYKEIQSGAVAKSYMRKGFLIYDEMRKYLPIYEEAVSHIWLCNCSIMNFLEGLDVNLNREKLKTTLVPMPYTLSPLQPASWISRHSQDGGKVVKQEKLFGSLPPIRDKHGTIMCLSFRLLNPPINQCTGIFGPPPVPRQTVRPTAKWLVVGLYIPPFLSTKLLRYWKSL